jgi:hypothetical protein
MCWPEFVFDMYVVPTSFVEICISEKAILLRLKEKCGVHIKVIGILVCKEYFHGKMKIKKLSSFTIFINIKNSNN